MTKHHLEDVPEEVGRLFLRRRVTGHEDPLESKFVFRLYKYTKFGDIVVDFTEPKQVRPWLNYHVREEDSERDAVPGLSRKHFSLNSVTVIYDHNTESFKRYKSGVFVENVLSREESLRG